jgi:hypothetical protein
MPCLPSLLYSSIPLPARVASKELAKLKKRLLLIVRGAKLVRRLVCRVLPFLTLALTTLTTLPALLRACRALSYTCRTLLAVLRACKAFSHASLSHARNFLLALTPVRRALPSLL